jgi:hypothetical protein
MINGYKTTSDLPKEENMIKIPKSEFDGLTTAAFTYGILCGFVSTMLFLILANIIKNILN